ncbi:hypothetical protein CHS0354_019622, partial [Potamilus streckersoni]
PEFQIKTKVLFRPKFRPKRKSSSDRISDQNESPLQTEFQTKKKVLFRPNFRPKRKSSSDRISDQNWL